MTEPFTEHDFCYGYLRTVSQAKFRKAAPSNSIPGHMVADILALNKIRRYLADTSAAWDTRLYDISCFLHWQLQQSKSSDSGVFDSSLSLSKVVNASFGRSREAKSSLTTNEEAVIGATLEFGTRSEREHVGGNSTEQMTIQTAHKQPNGSGPLETSGKCGTADDDDCEFHSSSVASTDAVNAHFTRNVITTSVCGVHPLLLDKVEESSVSDHGNSLLLSRQLLCPSPIAVAREIPACAISKEPVQEASLACRQGTLSLFRTHPTDNHR